MMGLLVVVLIRGNRLNDGTYDGTIARILNLGGLSIKAMVVSGEDDKMAQEMLGDQVLGINYDVTQDMFRFPLDVYIYPKRRGVRTGDPLNVDTLQVLDTFQFTPRILTGLVNSFYDPLRLMSPWLVKFKLLLKKLTETQ